MKVKTKDNIPKTLKDCRTVAVRLLAKREYSRAALARKLREKGYLKEEVSEALDYCQVQQFLNDDRFVGAYIRSTLRRKPVGPYYLIQNLRQKGISEDTFWKVWETLGFSEEELLANAKERYTQKYPDQQKLRRFLQGRGFRKI